MYNASIMSATTRIVGESLREAQARREYRYCSQWRCQVGVQA